MNYYCLTVGILFIIIIITVGFYIYKIHETFDDAYTKCAYKYLDIHPQKDTTGYW